MTALSDRWRICLDLATHPWADVMLKAIGPEDHIQIEEYVLVLSEKARVDLRAMWNSACRSLQASESTAFELEGN